MVEEANSSSEISNEKTAGKKTGAEENHSEEKGAAKGVKTASGIETSRFASEREEIDELLQVNLDPISKAEVSASTVVKMMGLASSSELKVIEGKIDLLAGRLGNLSIRLERVMSQLSSAPSASDLERLEGQLVSIGSMIKNISGQIKVGSSKEEKETKEKLQAYVQKTSSEAKAAGDSSEEVKPPPEPGAKKSEL